MNRPSKPKNAVLAGAPGSGKTTSLAHLLTLIADHKHLVTLEETPELRIRPLEGRS